MSSFKKVLSYLIFFILSIGPCYEGVVHAEFGLNTLDYDIFFDFRGQEIKSLVINGSAIPSRKLRWNKLFLTIPKVPNDTISFNYFILSHFCILINKMKSPYIFSTIILPMAQVYIVILIRMANNIFILKEKHFSIINCLKFSNLFFISFPCIDQPDLKATMKMTVVSPLDWLVISNEHFFKSVGFDYKEFLDCT